MEIKTLPLESLQLKMDGEGMTFSGYASVFGGVDSYGDTIDPKAYDKTIKRKASDRPIRMRWNHYGPVIGKWTAMRVDEKGLYVEGELTPGHSTASDVYASLKHGAIDGMSIGYIPKKIEMVDEGKRRLLKEIELVEISVVEEPADKNATVSDVKSCQDLIDGATSLKEIETVLREAGRFSRADATALVGRVKSLVQSESVPNPGGDIAALFKSSLYIPK